jgi:hypothetical protein
LKAFATGPPVVAFDVLGGGGMALRRLLAAEPVGGIDDDLAAPAGDGCQRTQLKAANRTHLERVRELFLDRLSDAQLQQLADIWDALEP